ncbi:MAG: oligosaccharide flippase family protein [Parvularculaceae bacterium]
MSEASDGIGGMAGRAARGAAWIVAARFVMRSFGFVNTIILARLLVPEDFGLVAVAMTAMQLLQGFSDIGISQAVVRFHDADRDDLDTLFTLGAVRGSVIAFLLCALAPLAAQFYGDPRMFWVFVGIAFQPFLMGLLNPRFFEFERNLDFSKEFISNAVNKFAGVAVSIVVAVVFRTYWAIILGVVTSAAIQLALSYVLRPSLPRFTFKSFKKVIGFSGWLTGVSFVAALNNKLDAFVLARVVGHTGTGVYYVGKQIGEMPTNELAAPIARAIYPGLSSLQGNRERMRTAYLRGVEALAAVAMPAALGFAFVANEIVPLLLGDKWLEAIPVVQVLTPILGLQTLFLATQFYAMALGETRLVFFRELIFFLVRFPTFLWASIHFGLDGAIYATGGCGLIHVLLNLTLYARATRRPFWEPLWQARRSFAAIGAMSVYFLLLRPHFGALLEAPLLARLVTDVAIGGVLFTGAHLALWRLEGEPSGAEQFLLGIAKSAVARFRGSRASA